MQQMVKKLVMDTPVNPDMVWKGIRRLSTVSIHIKKGGGDNPLEIFESMNSTGLELSNTASYTDFYITEVQYRSTRKNL